MTAPLSRSGALALIASIFCLGSLPACDRDDDGGGSPAVDMSADMARDALVDSGVDSGADSGADASALDMELPRSPCEDQRACQGEEVCLAGFCALTPSCSKPNQGPRCVGAYESLGLSEEEADTAFCDAAAGRCRLGCVRDSECASGEVCADDGLCQPFGGQLTGVHPGGEALAPLRAGVGNTLMKFPIGLSLGGYGSRAGNDPGRYSEALVSSHGQMHGLYARALLLDNGARQIMLIRMPIIFPTGPMLEMIARRLQERTGRDWRDSLVVSGTHTHSGPGRFLHLPEPDASLLPLGSFGTDNFNDHAFTWIVDSAVEAAELAFDDLSEARLGWQIVEAFDTDDAIASDRWGATPPFDDNRLLMMRVDDLEGSPRALLMSFGMHGTYFDQSYASGDAAAGVERAMEVALGEEYDRFVPTLFFNQNGGTMSPRGDALGHKEIQKMEHLGYRFAERAAAEAFAIETDREVELAGTTLRFPLGYDTLGYGPSEWGAFLGGTDELKYGGLQCDVAGFEDDDPQTYQKPGTTRCVGLDFTLYNRPPTLFLRSQMTALQIDGLTIVTLPGEAAMELGWQVLRELEREHDIDPLKAWTWGYAQDHQFYLTPSNLRGELPPFPGISTPMAPDAYPDYTFSYYQGGYEAGFTIWGARMGDYLVDRAVDVTGQLLGEAVSLPFEQPLPTQYSPRGHEPFPIEVTPLDLLGQITSPMPATVARHQAVEFGWIGGDPGAEMPQAPRVVLERVNGDGAFEPVLHHNRREYDNREPLMLTRLRLDEQGARREWVIYWEELEDFPLGTYRFSVSGHYLNEAQTRTPYELSSESFELVGSESLSIDEIEALGATLTGRLSYEGVDSIKYGSKTAQDPAKITGSYRMRHPDVPSGAATPLDPGEDIEAAGVTLRLVDSQGLAVPSFSADRVTQAGERVGDRDGVPVTRFEVTLPAASMTAGELYTATIEVIDSHGNRASSEVSFTYSP